MQGRIRPFWDYYVVPDDHKNIGFLLDNDHENAPVSGTIIQVPPLLEGRPGDKVLFQYNAFMDAQWIHKGLFIEPDIVYLAGDYTQNRWVLLKRTGDGMGEVVYHPRRSFLRKGWSVLYNPQRSHQLELPLFNTLTEEEDKSLIAVRYDDILMYDKN